MPLTNAEKQSRARKRAADKLARYEAALREIAALNDCPRAGHCAIARTALGDGK